MCWLDRLSIKQILELRDEFGISTFVETGVFKGVNVRLHANNFKIVLSCDIKDSYIKEAKEKTKAFKNVKIYKKSSNIFLRDFIRKYKKDQREDIVFIYLDAHFYDPNLREKWVVRDELKALKGFKNCIICIHDFDNNLGHCTYDGEPLGWNVVKDLLKEVNPDFKYYTNELATCDIIKEKDIPFVKGLVNDFDTRSNIRYAWTEPRLTYRGFLYCLPGEINLKHYDLKKWNLN